MDYGKMNRAQLDEYAESLGILVDKRLRKDELIETIKSSGHAPIIVKANHKPWVSIYSSADETSETVGAIENLSEISVTVSESDGWYVFGGGYIRADEVTF